MSVYRLTADQLQSFTNKTILITGGASGIGLATAQLILSLSPTNNVAILDRAPQAPALNSANVLYHQCDITNWAQQREGFIKAVQRFGRIDAVYVNAGIADRGEQFFGTALDREGKLAEPDRTCLTVDLDAACDTVKLAIYYLRRNAEGGAIVMTASLAGYLASAGMAHYSAAKHGVVGLMRALKGQTAKLRVAISVVAPGITVTPILLQNRGSINIEDWSQSIQKAGMPINKAESVALAVADLMNQGMDANGKGILVQADRMWDLERGIVKSREAWMGKEMLNLFRGGRTAGLSDGAAKGKL